MKSITRDKICTVDDCRALIVHIYRNEDREREGSVSCRLNYELSDTRAAQSALYICLVMLVLATGHKVSDTSQLDEISLSMKERERERDRVPHAGL